MSSNNNDEWITVEEAAGILRVVPRQVNRYGNEKRIRIKRTGRRVFYHRADVTQLAEELGAARRPAPPPKTELVPAGVMLDYLRERDQQLANTEHQLAAVLAQLAAAQQDLGRRMLPEDEQKLRSQLIEVAAERDQIRSQFEALRNEINPWYRRWQVLLPIAIAALAVAITLFVLLLSRP
jgi:hypothetical protein